MTVINALTTLIQDRVNHLSAIQDQYEDTELIDDEVDALERCLDILVTLEEL